MSNNTTKPQDSSFTLEKMKEILGEMKQASRLRDEEPASNKYDFTDDKLNQILDECLNSKYKFLPYKIDLRLKGRGKIPREISMPATIKNKLVLKLMNFELNKSYPLENQTPIAAQTIRDFTNQLEKIEPSKSNNFKVMRLDIKGFFDNIDHDILLNRIREKGIDGFLFNLIESAIKNSSKEGYNKAISRDKGVPQGTSIANYLADLYITEFDKEILDYCEFFYRYIDDIIIVYDRKNKKKLDNFIDSKLEFLKLERYKKRDKVEDKAFNEYLDCAEGLNFLGYNIRYTCKEEEKVKIVLSVRESSEQKFINSIIGIFTKYKRDVYRRKYKSTELANKVFAFDINEKITGIFIDKKRYGWLWYFNQLNDLGVLDKIDKIIAKQLAAFNLPKDFKVKKLKRTYYEIKNFNKDTNNYILNYGLDDPEKIIEIYGDIDKGIRDAGNAKDYEGVLQAFRIFRNRRIKKLDLDQAHHY